MAGKLVFGMQESNWFQVGDSIVTLEKIRGNRIRISIQAPPNVRVLRDRVVERRRQQDEKLPTVRSQDKQL